MVIEILLITNLWILFYKVILVNLRLNFVPKASDQFLMPLDFPKPFDIPLYIVLSVFFVMLIYIIHRYLSVNSTETFTKIKKSHVIVKLLLLIFLISLFINNIGEYPLFKSQYSFTPQFEAQTYSYFLIISSVILFLFSGIIILLRKILIAKPVVFDSIFFVVIILVIAFFTLEARFPASWNSYSFFYGPVWEIVHGKTIFTRTVSQYGFGSILSLAVFYKLGLHSLDLLPVINWIFFILQYFLLFFILYKISRSIAFAVAGLLSIFAFLFSMPALLPNYSFRWLPIVMAIFFLYKLKNADSKIFIFLLSILSFFTVDAGLYLILAYTFSLFLLVLKKVITLKKAVIAILTFALFLLSIFLFFNLIHLLFGYKAIGIVQIFTRLGTFAKGGLILSPMTTVSYFWFVPLIFFSSLILFFRNQLPKQSVALIVFTACLTFFVGLYYVGNSKTEYLYYISLFILFNIYLVSVSYFIKITGQRSKILLLSFMTFVLVIFPLGLRKEAIADNLLTKINSFRISKLFKAYVYDTINVKLAEDASLINKHLKQKKVLIIQNDDTYLFYLTKKENLLNINPIGAIVTKKELDFATVEAVKTCPQAIAVDCFYLNKCSTKHFDKMLNASWTWVDKFVLDKIETSCRIKYLPKVCSENLCIAEAV